MDKDFPEPSKPNFTPQSPAPGAKPAYSRPPARQWWIVGLLTVSLLASLAWVALPQEMGRWYLAAALEDWQQGEKQAAKEKLAKALEWNPTDLFPVVQRAEWAKEEGRYAEALADLELCERKAGEQPSLQAVKAQLLLLTGKAPEALAIVKKQNQLSQVRGVPDRATALNELAYFQALAKVDLPEALQSAERAIALGEEAHQRLLAGKGKALPADELQKLNQLSDLNLAQVLDTRGFVHYQLGTYEPALADLNRSIDLWKASFDEIQQPELPAESGDKKKGQVAPLTTKLQRQKRTFAVIYYHRSLILTALGKTAEAEADLKLSRELLGSEPDEKLF